MTQDVMLQACNRAADRHRSAYGSLAARIQTLREIMMNEDKLVGEGRDMPKQVTPPV